MAFYNSLLKEINMLQGARKPNALPDQLARGKNIYNGTSLAAHRGGVNIGRPKNPRKAAIARRLKVTGKR